jgi:predicted nucleic acid-binding protein
MIACVLYGRGQMHRFIPGKPGLWFRRLKSGVALPLTLPIVEGAVDIYRRAQRQASTVRSSVDCLVASCAVTYHLTVVHRDRGCADCEGDSTGPS